MSILALKPEVVMLWICCFALLVCIVASIAKISEFVSNKDKPWPKEHRFLYWLLMLGILLGPLCVSWEILLCMNIVGYCQALDPVFSAILSDEPFIFAGLVFYILLPFTIGSSVCKLCLTVYDCIKGEDPESENVKVQSAEIQAVE